MTTTSIINNPNIFHEYYITTRKINDVCTFIIENIIDSKNISNSIIKEFNDFYGKYIENLFNCHNNFKKHLNILESKDNYFDELDKLEKSLSESLTEINDNYDVVKNIKDKMVFEMI